MACTTLLVGRNASYDGSTLVARNEDCGSVGFTEKRFDVVLPEQQPKIYRSVLSHVEIPLPENPLRYTAMPDALLREGQWAAVGVNACNVSMSATETLTTNPRVQGADPFVERIPEQGKKAMPTTLQKSLEASGKRISLRSFCPIFIVRAKGFCVWANCWKPMAPTKTTALLFKT